MTTERIRELNDRFRSSFAGGKVVITAAVGALPEATVTRALQAVREFDSFTPDNDPYGEHDCGAFEADGHEFFFKIDCYDRDLAGGSEDPADPEKTTRVLTLMLASDY